MRRYGVAAVLGTGLGIALSAALAATPVAAADAIDDAWPYGVPIGVTTLPGFTDPGLQNAPDVLYAHDFLLQDPWYHVHQTFTDISSWYSEEHQVVTSVVDHTATFPSVGTIADQADLFSFNTPIGAVPLIQIDYLSDPQLGFASSFGFPGMMNIYLSDDAGIKDIVNFFGQTFTLFKIPFAPESTAADLGDEAQQLLTEFTSALPGADALLDLF